MHTISITAEAEERLRQVGSTLKSVLLLGEKFYLHHKVILALGADIHDRTDVIHPDNRALFSQVAKLLETPLIGIDFLCEDISRSFTGQNAAILEANSVPFVDMHHVPVTGKARNVAGAVLDYIMKSSV